MSKNKKFVSLADVVTKLADDPKVKAIFAKELKLKKESPARHERKFNLDLMNFGAEINFYCQQIGNVTKEILTSASDYSDADIDKMFDYRKDCITKLAIAQNSYDTLVAKLDQAIIDEDSSKVS